MIKAVIFDLDGTLIQTEVMKAQSYARTVNILTGKVVAEDEVLNGFKKYVGLSRKEVVKGLTEEFLEELTGANRRNSTEDMQHAIITKRLEIYKSMVNQPELLSHFFCPYNLGLLNALYTDKYMIALATMSHMNEVEKILDTLKIKDKLGLIMTSDRVSNGKPDPEIYLKSIEALKVQPNESIVIEDSVNGIRAAMAAGLNVFAATNEITRDSVHASGLLPGEFIIDDMTELKPRIYKFIENQGK
ncbi:MAG: HAD family phosphatase [Bacteroidales bacterium]|nr:HAD family phosphatase [Bacteroidales bacterium]MDT8374260.1 HAD family phosphatase [Bacteroidales bacterium]